MKNLQILVSAFVVLISIFVFVFVNADEESDKNNMDVAAMDSGNEQAVLRESGRDDDHEDKCERLVRRLCMSCKRASNRVGCVRTCMRENAVAIRQAKCHRIVKPNDFDDASDFVDYDDELYDDDHREDKCENLIIDLCISCRRSSNRVGCVRACMKNNAAAITQARCNGIVFPHDFDDASDFNRNN